VYLENLEPAVRGDIPVHIVSCVVEQGDQQCCHSAQSIKGVKSDDGRIHGHDSRWRFPAGFGYADRLKKIGVGERVPVLDCF